MRRLFAVIVIALSVVVAAIVAFWPSNEPRALTIVKSPIVDVEPDLPTVREIMEDANCKVYSIKPATKEEHWDTGLCRLDGKPIAVAVFHDDDSRDVDDAMWEWMNTSPYEDYYQIVTRDFIVASPSRSALDKFEKASSYT